MNKTQKISALKELIFLFEKIDSFQINKITVHRSVL